MSDNSDWRGLFDLGEPEPAPVPGEYWGSDHLAQAREARSTVVEFYGTGPGVRYASRSGDVCELETPSLVVLCAGSPNADPVE